MGCIAAGIVTTCRLLNRLLAEPVYLGYNRRRYGRIAQLVRALLSHSRGPGFESLCAHKSP